MTHADYDCCAICDSKLRYSNDASTKGELCSSCLKGLRSHGLNIIDVSELIEWIKSNDKGTVSKILQAVGFKFCCYLNDIDDLVKTKGIKRGEDRTIVGGE